MNPLLPLTYYLRHKRRALVQVALISLATVGLYILVAVLDTIPMRVHVSYLTKLSQVTPTGAALDPAAVAQIQTHPDVARMIPDNGIGLSLPTLLGTDSQRLLGVSPEDALFLMQHCGVRLKEGRMFSPSSNEILLSEEVARALDLSLGSEISRELDQGFYGAVVAPLKVVGILEADPQVSSGPSVRLGFVSAAYLNNHERYAPRSTQYLVVAKAGRKAAVDAFLETTMRSKSIEVETLALLMAYYRIARVGVYVVFGVVNSVVAVAVAFIVGVINRINITRRLREFGLLHALGHRKDRLIRRLTLETATVAGIGWLLGLSGALLVMSWLKHGLFYNLGVELDVLNPAPFFFVLPIPVFVIVLIYLSVRRVFARLDAVAIVERDQLSEEPQRHWAKGRKQARRSFSRPLSSRTYTRRHRRRGVWITLGTALMVLSITLPVFLFSAMTSAIHPYMEHLQYVSEISPVEAELDPSLVGQIKSHTAVARTIPTIRLNMQMVLPPGGGVDVHICGVSEADMRALMDVFGLRLQQGRLPHPRSNEVVLSSAIVANRDLHLGDVIGGDADDADIFIYDSLPTELVVVGILSPDRPWVGFASYAYLRSHEYTASRSTRLFVVPREGQKSVLDAWLEANVSPTQAQLRTYATEEREYREMTLNTTLTFALLESVIALVAAVALATLNHIFFAQRREEFGVLNALGHSRRWLVGRTIRETGYLVGAAWAIGALLCGVGLGVMQRFVYDPRGLELDFFSPAPWLLTTPMPLVIILSSAGTIAVMLSKLDPVSVIERR